MSQSISFSCAACQQPILAVIGEVGQTKPCPVCGAPQTVPFPRLKVGGGTQENKSAAPSPAVLPPVPAPTPAPAPEVPQQPISATAAPVPVAAHRSPPTARLAARAGYAVVFFACMGLGWWAVSGDGLGDRTTGLLSSLQAAGSTASSQKAADLSRHVDEIVMSYRAARLARESIETDLNVSLAEMQSRGMQTEADVVRKAIARKTEQIKAERQRASTALEGVLRLASGQTAAKAALQDTESRNMSTGMGAAESALLQKMGAEMATGDGAEAVRKAMSVWDQSI